MLPIGIIILLLLFGYFFFTKSTTAPSLNKVENQMQQEKMVAEKVDYKASFAIFTHGTFRVFTAAMYHNLSEEVFIQADNPNIVHVKKNGVTWGDFFETLPFKLTRECLTTGTGETFCARSTNSRQAGENADLKFYLNGVRADNILDKTINAGDQVLISYGNESDAQIQKQLQQIPSTD